MILEYKIGTILYNLLGWPVTAGAFFASFGDIKSLIIFLLGAVFLIQKIWDKKLDSEKKNWIWMITSGKGKRK